VTVAIKFFRDTYVDSVVQLRGMRAMREVEGVEWASAAMATPANVETLQVEGVESAQVVDAGSNDFFLVVRAATDSVASQALSTGEAAVMSSGPSGRAAEQSDVPRTLADAVLTQPGSNVAVISVPGDYAALAAYQALSADLHVLLFSDNVPVDKEVALKNYALSRGRLLMGPGAGTAMLGGVGLGFANVVKPGPVGVVAAVGFVVPRVRRGDLGAERPAIIRSAIWCAPCRRLARHVVRRSGCLRTLAVAFCASRSHQCTEEHRQPAVR